MDPLQYKRVVCRHVAISTRVYTCVAIAHVQSEGVVRHFILKGAPWLALARLPSSVQCNDSVYICG